MTDAELLASMGTDAAKWTDAFTERFMVIPKDGEFPDDEPVSSYQWGTMVAWFASAIETGRSAAS